MKIVHVLTRGDVLGGAQSHVRELSLELRRLGHEVTVITGAPGIFTDQLRQAGIPWLQVRSLVRPLRPHLDVAASGPAMVCPAEVETGSGVRAYRQGRLAGTRGRAAASHPQCLYPSWMVHVRSHLAATESTLLLGRIAWPAGSARASSTCASLSGSSHSNSESARQRRWRWSTTA